MNKSESLSETKKKLPAKSSSATVSPKGQQKKINSKENAKTGEKSTTAKSGKEKTKTSPKPSVTKAKVTTKIKSNNKVDLNDITKKVKEASIADTSN